jgi:alanyl-tRNA synthetase
LDKIEEYVNNAITVGFDVFMDEISKEEAKASGVE